jgi:hypothetical protein
VGLPLGLQGEWQASKVPGVRSDDNGRRTVMATREQMTEMVLVLSVMSETADNAGHGQIALELRNAAGVCEWWARQADANIDEEGGQ